MADDDKQRQQEKQLREAKIRRKQLEQEIAKGAREKVKKPPPDTGRPEMRKTGDDD
jgi:hypothetical protein